ncbi:MAG TPA: aldo/keto reductase [Blastocatellia bacterium]|nr:aldo/keto reductase [Blastocatellia bacterium]
MNNQQNSSDIPLRALGLTGVEVTAIGVGGYHLGLIKDDNEAIRLTQEAIDAGITFLDNAWEYHDGRSEELMGRSIHDRRDKVFLMTKVCTHGRDRHVAMRQLEDSLRRLKTDYLDLWQVHEVVYDNEPELHFADGGVIEALEQARREGKVRFTGFTGHKSPEIHLKMLSYDYPFDACQLPLNCFDATFRSFERKVLPELERRGIAAIGMKSLGGEGDMVRAGAVAAEEALRYAMSLPIATVVSGMESLNVLRQNLGVARSFTPMSDDEMRLLRERCAAMAGDGRFEQFKTTAKFEGPVGREQHGFPPQNELKI